MDASQTEKPEVPSRGKITPANLTPKQEKFCQEYLVDLNATKAAVRSGYSMDSAASIGHENLREPEIQKRLKELQLEQRGMTLVTQEYVISRLIQLVELCMTPTYGKWNPGAAMKGLELLGRHQGLFMPGDAVKSAVEKLARDSGAKPEDAWQAIRWLVQEHHAALKMAPADGRQRELSDPEKTELASLTDDERAERIAAILDSARERRDKVAAAGGVLGSAWSLSAGQGRQQESLMIEIVDKSSSATDRRQDDSGAA